MSLGEIIRKKRLQQGMTLDELSHRCGYSKPYLSTIETSKVKNPPSDKLLQKLERLLDFEAGILLHIAHLARTAPDIRDGYEHSEAENKRLRHFIKRLMQGDQVDLENLNLQNDIEHSSMRSSAAGRLVPIINRVEAGYPQEFNDLDYPVGVADDYVRCPDLHDPNAFAVRVVGDSMEPKFCEGDIVVFSPAAEVHNGDDCFVRFKMPHETTFKRIFFENDNTIRLQPRNERYSPFIIKGKRVNGIYRAVIKYERL